MNKKHKKENVELVRKTYDPVNPFQMMSRFAKDMEKVEWMPPVEVFQNNGQFIVRADLPGLTKDDVKVEVADEFLMISGERKEEKEEKEEGFYRSERSYGTFYRQIPLPENAMTENAAATFLNGVLEITVPAPKVAAPTHRLEIKEPVQGKSIAASA